MLRNCLVVRLVVLWCFSITSQIAEATDLIIVGEARAIDDGKLLYTELHTFDDASQHRVEYFDPDCNKFTVKELSFGRSDIAPAFEQFNTLTGELIKLENSPSGKLILSYKKNADASIEESGFDVTENLVVDAGFDNFIKNNWSSLQAKEIVKFIYLMPTRGKTIELELASTGCNESRMCMEIRPENSWLRMFASPIYLEYDASARQLKKFTGKGNITDKNGNYLSVEISYQYSGSSSRHDINENEKNENHLKEGCTI